MTASRVIRCDCGFEAIGTTDEELVAGAQRHALDAHGTEVSRDLVLDLATEGLRQDPPRQSG